MEPTLGNGEATEGASERDGVFLELIEWRLTITKRRKRQSIGLAKRQFMDHSRLPVV